MKTVIALILLLNYSEVAIDQVAKEVCCLSIKTEKEVFKPCEPIYGDISLNNNTEKPLVVYETSDESDYKLMIFDAKGKEVKLTQYLKTRMVKHRLIVTKILTKDSKKCRILINRIYDMSLSGDYIIKVRRSIEKPEGNGLIDMESQSIKVKIE